MGSVTQAMSMVRPGPMGPLESEKPIGRVLVAVEDYTARRELHTALYAAGFDVTEASGMNEVTALARAVRCEVALVPVRMAGRHAGEICGELRTCCPGLRVLMLTDSDSEQDQLEALDAGADDCIAKPLRMSEVLARVRAAVRRSKTTHVQENATIRVGEIEVDPARRVVHKGGNMVHLTPKEFDLLVYLMMHAGTPIPHRKILAAVWGEEHGSRLDYLRTFVRQLRRKLEDQVGTPRYLLTHSHIGYRFADKNEILAR
jgi:two-component system KDP operon response regulator KdpE